MGARPGPEIGSTIMINIKNNVDIYGDLRRCRHHIVLSSTTVTALLSRLPFSG